ncbi:hypothetical protein EXIGLDRAFT_703281 [Exidia glandulosa HHB12029]|uniref:Uncharacterized protein n=1 Tax=Exidia glandulosa HHB12029 TaxID=1314781 RepID=A0A165C4N7_EXIGL|nr:hypothetical protein EXIGLDRAFT_703281 [Exidia glandulosa HHB12029]
MSNDLNVDTLTLDELIDFRASDNRKYFSSEAGDIPLEYESQEALLDDLYAPFDWHSALYPFEYKTRRAMARRTEEENRGSELSSDGSGNRRDSSPTEAAPARPPSPEDPPAQMLEKKKRQKVTVEPSARVTRAQSKPPAAAAPPAPPPPPPPPPPPKPAKPPPPPPKQKTKAPAPATAKGKGKEKVTTLADARTSFTRNATSKTAATSSKNPAQPKALKTYASRARLVQQGDDSDGEGDDDDEQGDLAPDSPTRQSSTRRERAPVRDVSPMHVSPPPARSSRYTAPMRGVAWDLDDDVFGPAKRNEQLDKDSRGTKRDLAFRSSLTGGDSPLRKRERHQEDMDALDDFSHFETGRVANRELVDVAECALEIIRGGHKHYLPLHYFSDQMLEAEETSRVVLRPGDPESARKIVIDVDETTMSFEDFSTWSERHTRTLRALGVPARVSDMFEKHYSRIIAYKGVKEAWTRFRSYDIRQRRAVKGSYPADISSFDHALFDDITSHENTRTLSDMQHALAQLKSHSNPRARKSGGADQGGASASSSHAKKTDPVDKFVFDRCFVCGGTDHTFKKATPREKRCKAIWLVWDADRDVFKTPDSGAYVCYAYNSRSGCKRRGCSHSHVCSLCGASHGAGKCTHA